MFWTVCNLSIAWGKNLCTQSGATNFGKGILQKTKRKLMWDELLVWLGHTSDVKILWIGVMMASCRVGSSADLSPNVSLQETFAFDILMLVICRCYSVLGGTQSFTGT